MARPSRPLTHAWATAAAAASLVVCLAAAPQYSPWGEAVNIGATVDWPDLDDGGFSLSKDGRSLYFVSQFRPGGIGRYDIWVTHWDEATMDWGEPANLGNNVNSAVGEFTPALSRDEHYLFFASNRPGSLGGRDLYVSYREQTADDLGWEPAVSLGPAVNTRFDEFGAAFFENEEGQGPQLFFGSNRGGSPDIFVTEIDAGGQFLQPAPVPGLSSAYEEVTPAITHDGLEMFFGSNRPGVGGMDIWTVTRETLADPWSEPVNLGTGVNTEALDTFPAVSGDRTTLVFMRAPTVKGEVWTSTRSKIGPR